MILKITKSIYERVDSFFIRKAMLLFLLFCVFISTKAQTAIPVEVEKSKTLNSRLFAVDPLDIDGDGVPNNIDLDDDNDGILDTDESKVNYVTLDGFKAFSPASIPAAGLVVGDRLIKTNALSSLGISYDAIVEITSVALGSSAKISIDNIGNIVIQNTYANQNPYFTYKLFFVPTGTATPTGVLAPTPVGYVTLSLADIDGDGSTKPYGEVVGFSNLTSSPTGAPIIGSTLTEAGFTLGTSGNGGPGTSYNYYRPAALNATTGIANHSNTDYNNVNYSLVLSYDSYTVGEYAFGITGTFTTLVSERKTIMVASIGNATDTDLDGILNVFDLDSDNDGCSDSNEYYYLSTRAAPGEQFGMTNGAIAPVDSQGKVLGASYLGLYDLAIMPSKANKPLDQLLATGVTAATFSALTQGLSTNPTYKWQLSTNSGATWTDISNGGKYSGATTSNLQITGVTLDMNNYNYRVLVGSEDYVCGILTSPAARLGFLNFAPVAVNNSYTVAEDNSVVLTPLTGDSDPDGDALKIISIGGINLISNTAQSIPVTNGTVTVTATGVISFTPALNFNSTTALSIPYVISDGSSTATANQLITVTAVNDAPIAVNDIYTVLEDGTVVLNPLALDTDVDGDVLKITSINGIALTAGTAQIIPVNNGTVNITAAGIISFSPTTNFNSTTAVIVPYVISDGFLTATANQLITVIAVNDAPIAVNDIYTVLEDNSITLTPLALDTDVDGDVLKIVSINGIALTPGTAQSISLTNGTVNITAGGIISFTPKLNFNSTTAISIPYIISDGFLTATANQLITVSAVNDAPIAVNDIYSVLEDNTVTLNPLALDTDVDGDVLKIVSINGTALTQGTAQSIAVTNGTVNITVSGLISFTPALNFNSTTALSIPYVISDGFLTATANQLITVVSVNDMPVANNDSATTFSNTQVIIAVASNDTDVDGTINPATIDLDPLTALVQSTLTIANAGTYTANANGTVTFVPLSTFGGTSTINYVIQDNQGGISNSATITVKVNADSDGDGVLDATEITDGTNPQDFCDSKQEHATLPHSPAFLAADCDGDGLTNSAEYGSNYGFPFDSNGSGVFDYLEVNNHHLSNSDDEIEIFNGVSPSSDDPKNNVFTIRNIEKYPNNSLQIFNRWGVLIYQVEGYGIGNKFFRGESEGRSTISSSSQLPEDTYFYFLKYVNSSGTTKERSGYLYINR